MNPQESEGIIDDKRREKNRGSDLRKNNVSGSEEVIGEKRPMTANADNQYSCNCPSSDCIHIKQSITNIEEKRKINASNISRSKKPKIQQIKSH